MRLLLSLFRYATFALALGGVFLIFRVSQTIKEQQSAMPAAPPQPPPARPYANMIAASGLIEAYEENISIATPQAGLVRSVAVKVGDQVKKDDVLFELDHRDLDAKRTTEQAAHQEALAQITVASATLKKQQNQFDRLRNISAKGAIAEEELQTRLDELSIAQAQLQAAESRKQSAQAQLDALDLLIERQTIRAPRDGTILQLQVRPGEWAGTDPKSPPLLLGRTDLLQVRVDIDEQNASRIRANQRAVAHVKGDREHPIDLTFAYTEPYVIPKASLTGASTERVDTRVLQVIYSFKPSNSQPIYVGQQVDVFIDETP